MANLITNWLNSNNFAELRNKVNAIVTVLSSGATGEYLTKSGNDNGEFVWATIQQYLVKVKHEETFTNTDTNVKLGTIIVLDTITDGFDLVLKRFTPTKAGYYKLDINGYMEASSISGTAQVGVFYYKNGGTNQGGARFEVHTALIKISYSDQEIVYFNGTTDYVEVYFQQIENPCPIYVLCNFQITRI